MWKDIKNLKEFDQPYGFLGYSSKWIDEDFNPKGIRECTMFDGFWLSTKWNNDQDCWDTIEGEIPTHWKSIPKPPMTSKPKIKKLSIIIFTLCIIILWLIIFFLDYKDLLKLVRYS